MCNECQREDGRNEKFTYRRNPRNGRNGRNDMQLVHGLLGCTSCGRCWNRDINAVKNTRDIGRNI